MMRPHRPRIRRIPLPASLALAAALAAAAAGLLGGCTLKKKTPPWPIPAGKFVFIDHVILQNGELLEGQTNGAQIDFPTYTFNKETKTLTGTIDFKVHAGLKIVYGDGERLMGAAGEGASTILTGIYALPFRSEGYGTPPMEIEAVDADGTAHLRYRGEPIALKALDKWIKIFTQDDEVARGDIRGRTRITSTDEIVNYGILDLSQITPW
jgi:hypothetical protein